MADTDTLLRMANDRLEGTLKQLDLNDQARQHLSCGFRHEGLAYVGNLTWKRVKYAGKVKFHFNLTVSSLDHKETVKMKLRKIEPGGLGKARLISLPKLNEEVERTFKHDAEEQNDG